MKETIHKALCACLGPAPDSAQAIALIREAYAEPENSLKPAAALMGTAMGPELSHPASAFALCYKTISEHNIVHNRGRHRILHDRIRPGNTIYET